MAGVLLIGRGDARLLQILKVPLSRTSVLFHLMRLPHPPRASPRVLGVDDFACGRGDIAAAHRGCLPAAVPEPEPAPPPANPAGPSDQADTPARRHAKRLFEAVHAVTDTGRSLNAAARELGLNRRTVRKYARAATWRECVRRNRLHRPTSLDSYLEYLRQRWEEGEHTATVLHGDRRQGLLRPLPVDQAPRQVARWITTAPSRRDLHTTEALGRLLEHCPEWTAPNALVRQFAAMLPAVVQGIITPFNSGVNKGRITDLKLQKRILAGRAEVPLLRHRVILMALLRRGYG
ncbi:hypothetical protein SSP24_56240 [Streptomyces spinoverrucosus]|uniref:HTH IS21-type domain-containing protein n=2 Tax=Streptomyces spinoverrucosus TaxID=284043 RepID=A0A4Y3VQL2_9ACTN|nr:hypothetical protein SSP24_56240 [Streptomyces spinoverrucosus]GHB89416.1 hypothetical protein GCM10010397_71960 [Streptomyces spinoverrucosus]